MNIDHPAFRRLAEAQSPLGRRWLTLESQLKRAFWEWRFQLPAIAKRTVDILVAGSLLAMLLPVLGIIALLVKADGGPVLFRQRRVGYRGREFEMLKFRSMVVNAEARLAEVLKLNEKASGITFKARNDPRITPIGKILRKTSLDEQPQLMNVLRGEMSLVGPRPALPREVAQYTAADQLRLLGAPGLTCLWQVGERNGRLLEIGDRNAIDFPEQVALDVRYIEHRSLWKDLWLMLKTLPAVLFGKGA